MNMWIRAQMSIPVWQHHHRMKILQKKATSPQRKLLHLSIPSWINLIQSNSRHELSSRWHATNQWHRNNLKTGLAFFNPKSCTDETPYKCICIFGPPNIGKSDAASGLNVFVNGVRQSTSSKKFYKWTNERNKTNLLHYTNDSFRGEQGDITWERVLQSFNSVISNTPIVIEGHQMSQRRSWVWATMLWPSRGLLRPEETARRLHLLSLWSYIATASGHMSRSWMQAGTFWRLMQNHRLPLCWRRLLPHLERTHGISFQCMHETFQNDLIFLVLSNYIRCVLLFTPKRSRIIWPWSGPVCLLAFFLLKKFRQMMLSRSRNPHTTLPPAWSNIIRLGTHQYLLFRTPKLPSYHQSSTFKGCLAKKDYKKFPTLIPLSSSCKAPRLYLPPISSFRDLSMLSRNIRFLWPLPCYTLFMGGGTWHTHVKISKLHTPVVETDMSGFKEKSATDYWVEEGDQVPLIQQSQNIC